MIGERKTREVKEVREKERDKSKGKIMRRLHLSGSLLICFSSAAALGLIHPISKKVLPAVILLAVVYTL